MTLFLILGIIVGRWISIDIHIPLLLTVALLVLLGILLIKDKGRSSIHFGVTAMALVFSVGILVFSLSIPQNRPGHYMNQDFLGHHLIHLKVRKVLKPTSFSTRYLGVFLGLDSLKVSGKVLVRLPMDSTKTPLHVDDELLVYSHLETIAPPLNPHQFNYQGYMEGIGVYHQLKLRHDSYKMVQNPRNTLYGLAANLRNKIISRLKSARFGEEELSILRALLLGQRNDISEATYNDYKNAGAIHILAVSGLHIGILLLLFQFILKPLERVPKGKTLKLVLIVCLLWGFAFLAGMSASVVRAVAMFSFLAYAIYLNRPSNTFNIVALSLFFILLAINPMLLFQVGFQMSYAAVLAIVWIYPKLQRFWHPKNVVLRKIWQLLSVSVAAQLGVLPISLFYFHQFPGLFFVSNLLIVPALGLILGMGILVVLLSLLDALPNFLVTAYNSLIGSMNGTIHWVAEQEAFIFRDIPFDTVQLLLTYLIILSLIATLSKPNFKRMATFLLGVLLFQIWSFQLAYRTRQKNALILAHKTRNSVLLHQDGNHLSILTADSVNTEPLIKDYKTAERIKRSSWRPLDNSYQWKQKSILFIDSLGVYNSKMTRPDYLVLTFSPKINLDRLIDTLQPKAVIADGSSYRSYVMRWAKTCKNRKLPFHFTGESGAFRFP